MRPVGVYIGGQRFSVKSDADDTYVRKLADYVDGKLEEVRQSSHALPENKQLILAALNITDELLQEKKRRRELKRRVQERTKAVLASIDRWQRRHGSNPR